MSVPGRNGTPSQDSAELNKIVNLSIPGKLTAWEIFDTPEDKGIIVPGRTDYVTLVAQIDNVKADWFAGLQDSPRAFSALPGSARPWLSPYFKAVLVSLESGRKTIPNCKRYATTVVQSGRAVKGFVCEHENKLLVYVSLMGDTAGDPDPELPPTYT